MQKYLLILISSFLLAACNNEQVFIGDTPDEAIKALETDFVQDMKDVQFIDINSEQKISIFDATTSNENEREYYVAFIEKKKKKWVIQEAFSVGNPAIQSSTRSAGNSLEAGFINMTTNSSTPQLLNDQYTFTLPNSEASLWVKVLE